ncbi:hypothetical protein G6F40_015992 [Rhizopus arrhizus]|nr:hypothetical protein G6F40_015992 [Rhizopus arrhizus]
MAPGQRRRLGRSALGGGIVRPGRGDGGQRRAAITGANDARLVRYRRAVDERDRRGAVGQHHQHPAGGADGRIVSPHGRPVRLGDRRTAHRYRSGSQPVGQRLACHLALADGRAPRGDAYRCAQLLALGARRHAAGHAAGPGRATSHEQKTGVEAGCT